MGLMEDEVEDWYKGISIFLFLILAVPTAAFMLMPSFETNSIFFPIELAFITIHELGHMLFGIPFWFTYEAYTDAARFIVVAGGTILQIATPSYHSFIFHL